MPAVPDNGPYPWEETVAEMARMTTESFIRALFQTWLMELDDDQLAALKANWDNIMGDAALDRVNSWVIAGNTIANLRSRPPGEPS